MVCVYRLSFATRTCLRIVLLCLAAAGVSPACQIATIDNPSDKPATKTTQRGRVINSITGEPVPFALVQLPGIKPLRAMLTGADGSFEFANVPAMLEINARKPGFLGTGVSQEGEMGSTTGISSAGEPVTLALVPEAVIVGHVTDERGEPMEGVKIKIYHSQIEQGRRSWQGVAEELTDDEGSFHAAELKAGQYYIAIRTDMERLQSLGLSHPNRSWRGYRAIVYYPDNRNDISALEIAAGQHIDVPIALSEEPVFEVSGRVAGGISLEKMKINMVNDRGDEFVPDITIEADGAFTIHGLAPGAYTVSAIGQKNATQAQVAEAAVFVTNDVNGLQLRPIETTSIPIKVTAEFTNPGFQQFAPLGRFTLQATVQPVETQTKAPGLNEQATLHGELRSLENLMPGTYSVHFTARIGYVSSAMCGSTDLMRENLVVPGGTAMPPIEVVVRDDTGTLTGSTQGVDWTTVVVASDNPNVLPQTSEVPGHSTFSLALAPGSYKVYAFSSAQEVEYANPAVLEHYASKAAQVTVTAGSTTNMKVDPIRAEN